MKLTRRKMIVVTSAGVAAAAAGLVGMWRFWSTAAFEPPEGLLEPLSADLIAAAPGQLSAEDSETLRRLAVQLAGRWHLPELGFDDLSAFLTLKTEQAPSYLGEYRNSALLYRQESDAGSETAALDLLLDPSLPPESPQGHAHRYVIVELLHVIMIHGGFRAFGYENYPGFAGGPSGYRRL